MIRENETKNFELEGTWYFIVKWEDNEIQHEGFTPSQSNKKEMVRRIEMYTSQKIPFKLYGVWQGAWRTDIFDLDPEIMENRFSKLLDQLAKERSKSMNKRKT